MTTGQSEAAPAGSRFPRAPVRRWMRARPADVIDVFVYVVVLNLAIEYVPSVISEGFTLSLLTAVLLKLALELVLLLKGQILTRLRAATSRRAKLTAAVSLWAVAAGSKLVVLELVDLVFGDAVSLGGFFSVTLLVFVLLASRNAVRSVLVREEQRPTWMPADQFSARALAHPADAGLREELAELQPDTIDDL
jgi:hypothetical protein